ncbi:MAG: hypothetical protein Q4E69_02465 [Bacilli bacterium]|nr:hypothetical protein [Bacilli bacterium]
MKNFIKLIKELKKTPRGKGILFFSFYLVFFLIIAIVARLVPNKPIVTDNIENEEDIISIREVNGYNYNYKYTINVDNNIIYVNGMKDNEEEKFTYTVNNIDFDYYKSGTLYYINQEEVDTPMYLNIIDNIDLLLSNSYYDSVVNYKSGKQVLRYQISSSTISNMLNSKDLDIEEIPNEIRVTQNNDRIDEVEIVLDSYCSALNICLNNMNIKMEYSGFDTVEEITND